MTSPVGITPDHLRVVQSILREHLPAGVTVWVFGSRAIWAAKDSSDLDLALEGKSRFSHKVLDALRDAFEDSALPYTVDVIDLNAIGDSFRQIVESQKIRLASIVVGDKASSIQGTLTAAPGKWQEVAVSDVASATIGGTPSRAIRDYWEGTIPWATAKDVASSDSRYLDKAQESISESGLANSAAKLMPEGTVVITARGTVGALAQLHRQMAFNQTCYALVPTGAIYNDFLYYALKGTLATMRTLTYGTVFQTITTKSFNEWRIPLPPLPEQSAIAHVLGTLDDKIELNRRSSKTLAQMARALFKSWFVDFEPVRAKISGRWQRGASLPGLPSDYYDLFPDRLLPSVLGDIPEGWQVKPLDEIATFLNGLALQKYPATDGPSLPIIKIPQLRAGHALGANAASGFIPSKYIVHNGDMLFSWSGSLEVSIWAGGDGALNQHLFKVSSDSYPKWLYYHWVREHLSEFRDIAADKTTTMGHIQRRHLKEALAVIPDSVLLDSMSHGLQDLLDSILALRLESRVLAAQRDALLPKLISGQIRLVTPR